MTTDTPLYIYAFCDRPPTAFDAAGIAHEPIHFVTTNGITAAVSDAPTGRLRPQRSHLSAHQRVVSALAAATDTLPAAFGLIANDESSLAAAIATNLDSLRIELDRVAGHVEMEAQISWDVPDLFAHLVTLDDELAARRDQLVAATNDAGDAPHELKVAVGRRVERVIAAYRDHTATILAEAVGDIAEELSPADSSGDHQLARLAALIDRDHVPKFEDAVHAIASDFDDSHIIRICGPFAPHSFVDLRLDLGEATLHTAA